MAYIPDVAVDRMAEVSAGAWKLYCFLARCRNQKTGKCCPSVGVIMETIGAKRSQTYEFRKELVRAGWATFDGNNVINLFGFDNPKSRTTNTDNKEDAENSPKSRNIPISRTDESDIPDETVRNPGLLYKEEPANRTSKEIHGADVQQVFVYWQATLNHPRAKLTPEREKKIKARLEQKYTVDDIKSAIDGCAGSPFHMGQGPNSDGTVHDDIELICRDGKHVEMFIARKNGNGQIRVAHKETHNERAARETAELFERSLAALDGVDCLDPEDTGAPWLAADFSRT